MGSNFSRVLPFLADPSSRPTLPPKPTSTCQACWEGPFAAHLGLFHTPVESKWEGQRRLYDGGFTYVTSKIQLRWRAAAGCVWCKLLRALVEANGERIKLPNIGRLRVVVGCPTTEYQSGYIPADLQGLSVFINNYHLFVGYVHADTGEFVPRQRRRP